MLSSEIPWNIPRVTRIFRIHTRSFNYFFSCINLLKIYGNLRDFQKLRKHFKTVFEFIRFLKISGKSSEVFGKLRKCLVNFENFGNGSKLFFWSFTIFQSFGKSSKVFGTVRKSSENSRT